MNFLDLYMYLIKGILLILLVVHIWKKDFKAVKAIIVAFVLTFLFSFLALFGVRVDALGKFLYTTLIFMTIYLGSTLKFYDKFAWWDIAIHFFFGITFVSFGVAIARMVPNLSPFNIVVFCFTFSTTLHVFWEIIEYFVDTNSHTDHQRWQKNSESNNHVSESAIQPAGLVDTMKDIIVCMISTILACVVWYFIL